MIMTMMTKEPTDRQAGDAAGRGRHGSGGQYSVTMMVVVVMMMMMMMVTKEPTDRQAGDAAGRGRHGSGGQYSVKKMKKKKKKKKKKKMMMMMMMMMMMTTTKEPTHRQAGDAAGRGRHGSGGQFSATLRQLARAAWLSRPVWVLG